MLLTKTLVAHVFIGTNSYLDWQSNLYTLFELVVIVST